jgi:hypothetical protein
MNKAFFHASVRFYRINQLEFDQKIPVSGMKIHLETYFAWCFLIIPEFLSG